ncbi:MULTISPECIES: DUF4435 domain-containing protein [Flavobacterium]|uniref:DUF4435 domain-containing protein n=1 Tax=Flavobacterium jumunjinense TaxID=998845 RepID=A0ABV5GSK5_9FLAO|nr:MULTISPECIES: DUF4435 domain-containing protein [Flavobacterium]
MIGFNYRSLKAIPRFFAYRNEIDIFTEDKKNDKEFYKALFSRLCDNKITINDITQLGCKANVLKAYDEQDKSSVRKKLFIVDGDLDLIIGTNRKSENNLVVLDSYCIENYIVDEKSALEILYYSIGTTDKITLSKKLNFDKWLNYNNETLIHLFLNFSILKMYGGGPILKSASQFLKQEKKQTVLDNTAVNTYSDDIKNQIISLLQTRNDIDPELTYQNELRKLESKWKKDKETFLKIISGKDYLIHLFQHRINYTIGKGKSMFPKQSFKLFLANHCDLERLTFLKKKII